MRVVNYKVARGNETFVTTSYAEATANGNRIIDTFLTEFNEQSEKEKEYARKRARKIAGIRALARELEHAPSYINASGVGAT